MNNTELEPTPVYDCLVASDSAAMKQLAHSVLTLSYALLQFRFRGHCIEEKRQELFRKGHEAGFSELMTDSLINEVFIAAIKRLGLKQSQGGLYNNVRTDATLQLLYSLSYYENWESVEVVKINFQERCRDLRPELPDDADLEDVAIAMAAVSDAIEDVKQTEYSMVLKSFDGGYDRGFLRPGTCFLKIPGHRLPQVFQWA